MLHERGHGAARALEAGEEIIAHGEGYAHGAGLEIEPTHERAAFSGLAGLEARAESVRRAIFHEIGELGEEVAGGDVGADIGGGIAGGAVLAFDEDFLELIEEQYRPGSRN